MHYEISGCSKFNCSEKSGGGGGGGGGVRRFVPSILTLLLFRAFV